MRKAQGRSGSTKVQLAERRDGRDVVLEHVGTARTEAELAVLMAQARRRLHDGQETLDCRASGFLAGTFSQSLKENPRHG